MTTVNSLNSHVGLAQQSAKGVPATETADFKWVLARMVAGGPVPRQSPLPFEIGGGMMSRGQVKLGVNAIAGMGIIPRANSIGDFLLGVAGKVTSGQDDFEGVFPRTLLDTSTQEVTNDITNPPSARVLFIKGYPVGDTLTGDVTIHGTVSGAPDTETIALNGDAKVDGVKLFSEVTQVDLPVQITESDRVSVGFAASYYVHEFEIDADPASTPYWTIRRTIGTKFGETLTDARVGSVVLDMAAVNFVEGQVGIDAIEPTMQPFATQNEHDAWVGDPDNTPEFISALGVVKLNGSYQWAGETHTLPVRQATLTLGNQHAVDEEFIVGSYFPRDIEILSRMGVLTYVVFVQDREIYQACMYDPDLGNSWLADVFASSEARVSFRSPTQFVADAGVYYGLDFRAFKTEWLVEPIQLRENNIVMVRVTGVVCQPDSGQPFVLTLRNLTEDYELPE